MRRNLWTIYFIIGFILTYIASSGFAISSTDKNCKTKECFFQEAEILFDSGKHKSALHNYEKACSQNHDKSCYVAGYLNAKFKNLGASVDSYKKACDLGLTKSCQKYHEVNELKNSVPETGELSIGFYKTVSVISLVLSILLVIVLLLYQFVYKKIAEKKYKIRLQEEIKDAVKFLDELNGDFLDNDKSGMSLLNLSEDEISKNIFHKAYEDVSKKELTKKNKKLTKRTQQKKEKVKRPLLTLVKSDEFI